MVQGTLEVLLVAAKGLDNTDFLCKMDPYAVLKCRTQEQKSSVASGAGDEPEWNETFVFTVSDDISEITIKLMDKDAITADDFVGEATIPLKPLFMEGSLPPTVYNVVKDQEYRGEIKVGLAFTPTKNHQQDGGEEENYGGWNESSS
ncbi:elicitor-responsive protein 3-like [Ananas comosus]|uniref:Elicitor-responsive protein 3-like n=1 Tax=Ananas comosus TaxID=4615 RepID=A0A6P5H2P2_ANACO|nr:elicitor-responsive protein 3-like [Ananas comosus]